MKDGSYTYYTFQHKVIKQSPIGKLTPLEKITDQSWYLSSWDYFGKVINPLNANGRGYQFVGSEESISVRAKTGKDGFWTLEAALGALRRLHEASEAGWFDAVDYMNHKVQTKRFAFRIVEFKVSQKTTYRNSTLDNHLYEQAVEA